MLTQWFTLESKNPYNRRTEVLNFKGVSLTSAQDLKDRVDLRDLVAHFWGAPDRKSNRYVKYYSRWRDDGAQPSFAVYATHFKDYGGDGIGGDVFTYLQHELNLDFRLAVTWLEQYTGYSSHLAVTTNNQQLKRTPRKARQSQPTNHTAPSSEWQAGAKSALRYTQEYLWSFRKDARRALHYLRTVRGLSDDSIRNAGYGYNPSWHEVDYKNADTGKNIRLAPGIIEPWMADGDLWALRIRCRVGNLADALTIQPDMLYGKESPKYLNLAGSHQTGAIYNGDSLHDSDDVLIVEGGFDAILAQQALNTNTPIAVITFGSATNLPAEKQLERIRQAKRIFLLFDRDEAGQSAQAKLIDLLNPSPEIAGEVTPSIYIVRLPQGKDVTDYIVQHNGDLSALLDKATLPAWWMNGVPNSIRSALLRYFAPATAPITEMINQAINTDMLNPATFTVDDLLRANVELGFDIPESTLRRVFMGLVGELFSKLDSTYNSKYIGSNNENNADEAIAKRGRRSDVYAILPLAQVKQAIMAYAIPRIIEKYHPTDDEAGIVARPTVAMMTALGYSQEEAKSLIVDLEALYRNLPQDAVQAGFRAGRVALRVIAKLKASLEDTHSTPLETDIPLSNAKIYRQVLLRATNNADERRSRRDIQNLIGVSHGSVTTYIAGAGLAKASENGEYEVESLQYADDLAGNVKRMAYNVRGRPMTIISQCDDGKTVESPYRGHDSQTYVRSQMAQGKNISIKFQVANHYVPIGEISAPEPRQRPSARPVNPSASAPKPTRKVGNYSTHFGRTHSTEWVRDQVILGLLKSGRLTYKHGKNPVYIDQMTGEMFNADVSPRAFVDGVRLK